MAKYKFISDEQDFKHLTDKERYKNLYEEVGTVEANKTIKWRKEWMKYFSPKPNSTILELGSHNGPNLLKYSREGFQIDGVELSQTLINTFKKNCIKESEAIQKRINLYNSWIEDFKIDKRYDYVLVTEVLEHVIDPIKILEVAQMHLKKNGIIYISSPTKHWGNNTHVRGVPKEDLMNWLVKSNLFPIEIWEEDGRTFCYARQKTKTKIIGLLRVRNEEQIILDTLKHMERFCNGGIFVYDDCSEDNTAEICENFQAVKKVIRGTVWDKNRAKAEFENRAAILKEAKKFTSNDDWFVYLDADERIEYDWSKLYEYPKDVIAIRMKLFDFYITPEDVNKLYTEREKLGPEYRKIIMAFRNLPTLEYKYLDQREVTLGVEGKIIDEGYVKHYGKAISVEEWEKTCDYYSKHFPMYSEKWEKRKGKAIHLKYSDFGNELITWEEKDLMGIDLLKLEKSRVLSKSKHEKKLKVLITNHHLLDFTGSEVYTLTLAEYLKKKNCEVYVYSKYVDSIKTFLDKIGVPVVEHLEVLRNMEFDIAHVHHNINAIEVRYMFPNLPIVYLSHGVLPFLEQPPVVKLNISRFLALSEEIKENLIRKNVDESKIILFPNIINSKVFKEKTPIHKSLRNVLVVSNKIDSNTENIIKEACSISNVSLKFVGKRFQFVNPIEMPDLINWADIVITLGRGAIEAMMCGRIPIVLDYLGGDGMVTPENFKNIAKFNFSGRKYKKGFTVETLVSEFNKYNSDYGEVFKNLAVNRYSAEIHIDELICLYREVINEKLNLLTDEENNRISFIFNTIVETRYYTEDIIKRKNGKKKNQQDIKEKLKQSEDFIERNMLEKAQIILNEILFDNPENVDALNNLAVVRILKSDFQESEKILKRILNIEPRNEIAKGNMDYLKHCLTV